MRPRIIERRRRGARAVRLSAPPRDRLERRYIGRSHPSDAAPALPGRPLCPSIRSRAPWFPLGTDALGRDQLARLAAGTRLSLGVALGAALGALLVGAIVGGLAGFRGSSTMG